MEITILGNYRPFDDTSDTTSKNTGEKRTQPTAHSRPPNSSQDDKHQLSARGNVILPRYELFPPTQDGTLNDLPELHVGTKQLSSTKGGGHGYDVEVFIKGCKVTWTQGGILRKILDFSSENETVRQTLFAWFIVNIASPKSSDRERNQEREREDYDAGQLHSTANPGADRQGRQQALVVILTDTARIYFPSGETHSVHLPFTVHKVWAMDLGLLLERRPDPGEGMTEEAVGEFFPRFYMLMDPLNELQIVTLYRLPERIAPVKPLPQEDAPRIRHLNGVMGDIFNTCVFLSGLDANDKTAVTFDLLQKRHRVWRYAYNMPSALPFSRMRPQPGPQDGAPMDIDINVDLQMRTDTYLFEIESNIHSASQDSTVFSAHAFDGSIVIGVLDRGSEKLSCYQILEDQVVVHLWTKPALSAVAAEATRRGQRDILMLTDKNELFLWTGFASEIVPCAVTLDRNLWGIAKKRTQPWGRTASGFRVTDSEPDRTPLIVELRDSVEDRISFVLSDGTILRAHLDFTVLSSLVQECLDVLAYALPTDVLWSFKHRFLQLQFDKTPSYADISAANEWDNFAMTLLSYCDPSFSPPVMTSPKMQSRALPGSVKKPTVPEPESDMEFFLNSDMHRLLNDHPSFRNMPLSPPLTVPPTNPYKKMIEQAQGLATRLFQRAATRQSLRLDLFYKYILVALHLVFEDRNINLATCNEGDMGPLLMLLSHLVGWDTWVDAYGRRDFSSNKNLDLPEVYMEGMTLPLEQYEYEPPDFFHWISEMVSTPETTKPFPTPASLARLRDPGQSLFPAMACPSCDQTRKIASFFSLLMTSEKDGDQRTVRAIVAEGLTHTQLDQLSMGVSVPLREALWKCRKNPSPDLSSDELSFIGRNDLAELASKRSPGFYMKPPSQNTESTKRQDIRTICADTTHKEGDSELETTGVEITESDITDLRFGADKRVAETKSMLQSSLLLTFKPSDAPDLSEEDLRAAHQEILCKLAVRTLGLPVGRAVLTFGTATPILNQQCPIPPINLAVKLLPSYGVVEPDISPIGGDHALRWPSFHNGVAAGLRISINSEEVNSSWIIYNQPEVLNSEHAGFLLALGLTGHLKKLVRSHVLRYLSSKHELTSTGLLLGLACAHRGSMNSAITRVLSVHMPALLPESSLELDLSPITQIACVLGIGLIYMETSHRRMAEVMLAEIGEASGTLADSANGLQECHSVAAGFGLGFITLGQGDKPMGLRDMKIVDTLLAHMPGVTSTNLGAANSRKDHGQEHRPSGVDMTSAGATVAMGLMYLKTNSKDIAAKLAVPETQFMLDFLTPDALMLRVICRAIVLWDSIVPSMAWILSQIPDFLKDTKTGGPPASASGPQSYYSILAGTCFAMGLRFAGSGNEAAYQCIIDHFDMFKDLSKSIGDGSYESSITKSTIRTCLDVVTMAAAMVMAGSGRVDFLRRLRVLHRKVKGDTSYGSHLAHHMALGLLFLGGGGYTLGTSNRSVAALLCSLYPRLPNDPMDNRSHLQAFRHLWVLAVEPRCLVTRDATTGACCPVPVRIHLKALSLPSQILESQGNYSQEVIRDGQRGHKARGKGLPSVHHMPAKVPSTSKLDTMTPCLLPELSTISKIEILGPRYWPITIDLSSENEDYSRIWMILKRRSVSVMRHIGHLSYAEDPLGMRGILARPFPRVLTGAGRKDASGNGGSRRRKFERLQRLAEMEQRKQSGLGRLEGSTGAIEAGLEESSASYGEDFSLTFLQDPQVASFASQLCTVLPQEDFNGDGMDELGLVIKDESRAAYFTNVLYECLTMDKVEVLGVHVWLYDIMNRLDSLDELSWRTMRDLRILKKHYDAQRMRRLAEEEEGQATARTASRYGKGARKDVGGGSGRGLEDDGSETLIKVSRVTELVSRITKRVEQAMESGRSDAVAPDWPLIQAVRHYFEKGRLPVDNAGHTAKTQSVPWKTAKWFKVWLELNEVPGPDAIQAIRRALDNTRDQWERYVQRDDGGDRGREKEPRLC
ncbi:Anaphase-promoting complex subunit 1 [Dissophora globulifera]|nr:Anaphase-promoting complex subunit 1 [Dissophora globulifera]